MSPAAATRATEGERFRNSTMLVWWVSRPELEAQGFTPICEMQLVPNAWLPRRKEAKA